MSRPVLRFPEFREAGEWINSTLGDISTITSGGTPSRSKNEYWNGNIPWVTTSLIDFNIIQSASEFISELGLKESSAKIFPKNTILMAMYGQGITRGKVAVLGIDAATNQACAAILLKKKIKTSFVFQNLVSRYDEIRDLSNQGGQENLSGGLIEKIPFSFPVSDDEQQKIAACLSSIDELITAQAQKVEALKTHKKGLMQQLFPAEGETVPKLRFPEFWEAGEWEEIKLIDTADKKIKWSFIGGPFGSNLKSSDYIDKGIRVIQLQNIGDAKFINNYQIFTSEEKANELLSNNIYSGDIILSKMGDPVGRACLIPNLHKRYVMCSDGIRLAVNEKLHSKYFVYSLINSAQFRSLIEKTATGSTRKRIGLDELKNLPMLVPELAEQQKIATCLSSLDELITAQTQKLAALKTHKKGLMQQLFPAVDEVVG